MENCCLKCLCLGVLTVEEVIFVLAEDKEMVHVFGISLCLIRKLVLTCLSEEFYVFRLLSAM